MRVRDQDRWPGGRRIIRERRLGTPFHIWLGAHRLLNHRHGRGRHRALQAAFGNLECFRNEIFVRLPGLIRSKLGLKRGGHKRNHKDCDPTQPGV